MENTQELLGPDLALAEVTKWLDAKKIKSSKRQAFQGQIETLVDGFMDGSLIFDEESQKLTQKLSFPIEDDKGKVLLDKLVFKPRLRVGELGQYLKGVASDDADGRVTAYVACISENAPALIRKVDTVDYSLSAAVVVFFA